MGAIEDLRKVIQDLVTPELKDLAAKLEMLEKRMDRLDIRMDRLFERAEQNANARMNQLFIVLERLEEERHQ